MQLPTRIVDKLRLFKHFFSSTRRRGLLRTVRMSLYEIWYERKFAARTAFVIPVDRLDYTAEAREHAEAYFPSSYLFLRETLIGGAIDCRGRVFIDYGCGMGRALLFASTLPFKRIIGVELSPSLCADAIQNLRRWYDGSAEGRPEWSVDNADARKYKIPDDATVFYFQNPFDAAIVGEVIDHIVLSVRQKPRQCYLVYCNPVHENAVLARGLKKIAPYSKDWSIFTFDGN